MKAAKRNALTASALSVLANLVATSGLYADEGPDTEPERIVVVATRSERPVSDVAAAVDALTGQELERQLAFSLDQMFRYLPGLAVDNGGTRFGSSGIAIRGIGDNRVAILLDGVPVPDQFDIGNYANASRDLVELGMIDRVEILRGPASTLYGSDAIGGVVAFHSVSPDSLLSDGNIGGRILTGYDGSDDSTLLNVRAAFASENLRLLLAAGDRQGQATDFSASSPKVDAQDYQHRSALARLDWQLGNEDELQFIAENTDKHTETNIQSVLGWGRFATTTLLQGDDDAERERWSLAWRHRGETLDATVTVYDQQSAIEQRSLEQRLARGVTTQFDRLFFYDVDTAGLEGLLQHRLQFANSEHRIGYGFSVADSDIAERRDGLQTNLNTGSTTTVILGETMPVRDFPLSSVQEWALYIHDEIAFGDAWELIPGLRYEHYQLDASSDDMWQQDNPVTVPVDVADDALTGKLAALYKFAAGQSVYLQFAEGFRAPPFDDANIGLYLPALDIQALPNPDLQAEQSQTWEVGWRGQAADNYWQLALFDTHFDDFIESKVNLGRDPVSGDTLFQSQNIHSARLYGLEAEGRMKLAETASGNWWLNGALFYGHGENEQSGQPLNSVPPFNGTLGVRHEMPQLLMGVELVGRFADAVDDKDETRFPLADVPGYAVFDLLIDWQLADGLALNVGAFNLFDETWWQWTDVRSLDASHPAIPLLSQPGLHVNASVSWQF